MNSAKKIMNQQKADDKSKKTKTATAATGTKKVSGFSGSNLKKIVLTVTCIALVLVLCIGVGVQQLKPKTVLKVNNTKFSLSDMMFPIYERESQYLAYDEMYQYYTGSSVWENTYSGSDRNVDSSATNSVGLKQEIMDSEKEYEVLYQEAKAAGYKLSDEDKDSVKDKVKAAMKGLSWAQKLQLNITKGNLTKRFEKRTLAENYKNDEQDKLNASVDEDAAIKDISKKDYREYDVQVYSVSTNTTDDSGNTKAVSAKKKAEMLKKLQTVADKAKTAKDFTKLIGDKEEDITYKEDKFTEKDGWSMLTTKSLLKQVKAMKNDEISTVLEDSKSSYYVLVKMIDNNSEESYKTACDSAIQTAQNSAYDSWYQSIATNYKIKVNEGIWGPITIGTVTTDIVTAEDLQKMNEDSSDGASSDSSTSSK